MKKGRQGQNRSRQNRHFRDKAGGVISLPPPQPPRMAPRKAQPAVRAIPLAESGDGYLVQSKAQAGERPAAMSGPLAASPASDAVQPLPRSLALVPAGQSLLKRVTGWLAMLKARKASAAKANAKRSTTAQIKALRRDLAGLQKTLDRMLES